MTKALIVSSLVFFAGAAFAADKGHDSHPADSKPMMMEDMKGMMTTCMTEKKDAKACDMQAMTECQKSMPKGDCQKMAKEAKAGMPKTTK